MTTDRATSERSAAGWIERWKRNAAAEIEAAGGRHDEPAIYDGPPGDPGLAGGPHGPSWEIHGDLATLAVAGTAAIVMELLHPSVMAGVAEHSAYREDPLRRSRNSLGYVLRTTFGSTEGATRVIEGVKRMHERVVGVRPDGVPYRALDPELIGWVHTSIPWAVMTAYDRYRRPLSVAEKNRYLAEQAVIGRMGGAGRIPETVDELRDYVEAMRPKLAVTEQLLGFLEFVVSGSEAFPVSRRERFDRWVGLRASMSLLPEWAQRLTGTHVPPLLQRAWLAPTDRLKASLVRWVYPELPCKRMALARVRAGAGGARAVAAA
jgi:uncharacterized protein (DUF2236 family)